MEVALITRQFGDIALRHTIDDMRLMNHPAKTWEQEKQYWVIQTIVQWMSPSEDLQKEAWAEHRALRLSEPVKPYQRRKDFAATS